MSETSFCVTGIPSGGGVVRHMQYLPETGEIWFGSDMGTIGRAQVEKALNSLAQAADHRAVLPLR